MSPPLRTNQWQGVEFGKVVIVLWYGDLNRRVCRGDGGWGSCTFFFLLLNHVIIDLGTKSCMQLALWHIKTVIPKNNKQSNKIQTPSAQTLQAGLSEPFRIAVDDWQKKSKVQFPLQPARKTLWCNKTSPPYLPTAAVKQEQRKIINCTEKTMRRSWSRRVFGESNT